MGSTKAMQLGPVYSKSRQQIQCAATNGHTCKKRAPTPCVHLCMLRKRKCEGKSYDVNINVL